MRVECGRATWGRWRVAGCRKKKVGNIAHLFFIPDYAFAFLIGAACSAAAIASRIGFAFRWSS